VTLIRANWSNASGVSFSIETESPNDALAAIAALNGAPSATVTPAKQEAARASTAAGKGQNQAAAETKVVDKPADVKKPTVDYPTLQKAVFDLVGAVKAKGLDPAEHVLGIAKKFGYDNFAKMKEAGPEGAMQFESALAAVHAKAKEVADLVVEEAVA
jgi:hypothetical protein